MRAMATVLCVLYDDPVDGYPSSYARDGGAVEDASVRRCSPVSRVSIRTKFLH